MFGIHFGTPEIVADGFSYRSQTTANVQEDDGLEFFEGDFAALQGVSLDIDKGEIVSLVGTSGCGKSTLLRIAAGLDFPTAGQVWVGDEAVRTPRPEICIVFQEPRLMP